MASIRGRSLAPSLERLPDSTSFTPTPPSKTINDGSDLTFFLSSTAYRDLNIWLLQLNKSMFPIKNEDGTLHQNTLTSPPKYSEQVQNLRHLISDLTNLIEQAPPDTGPRRFGNVAFRTWFKFAEDSADQLCESHLGNVLRAFIDESKRTILKDELKVYLLGSFGSAQRLDYGTGHELSFLAFLGCLWKLGAFDAGEERAIVVGVVQPYLELIRRLVMTYTLEPAGSHGVWGLDDHSFAPYIFGSAQLGPAIGASDPVPTEGSLKNTPSPSKVADKQAVADYSTMNMYFGAIQFIYDVKRGPFWEHSPVLYDVSGIKDGWAKINKGMLKMYAAEVLGKFPVVQHFPFGNLFRWEADAQASNIQASTHATQQTSATAARSTNAPPAPVAAPRLDAAAGTKAPWASNPQSGLNGQTSSRSVPPGRRTYEPHLPPGRTIPNRQREKPQLPGSAAVGTSTPFVVHKTFSSSSSSSEVQGGIERSSSEVSLGPKPEPLSANPRVVESASLGSPLTGAAKLSTPSEWDEALISAVESAPGFSGYGTVAAWPPNTIVEDPGELRFWSTESEGVAAWPPDPMAKDPDEHRFWSPEIDGSLPSVEDYCQHHISNMARVFEWEDDSVRIDSLP